MFRKTTHHTKAGEMPPLLEQTIKSNIPPVQCCRAGRCACRTPRGQALSGLGLGRSRWRAPWGPQVAEPKPWPLPAGMPFSKMKIYHTAEKLIASFIRILIRFTRRHRVTWWKNSSKKNIDIKIKKTIEKNKQAGNCSSFSTAQQLGPWHKNQIRQN